MKLPAIKESVIVSNCLKWLHLNRCFVWRNNTGAMKTQAGDFVRFGATGSPDIIGMNMHGRFLGVECKSAKGKLSDKQEAFGLRITDHGGLYIVARSTDDLEAHKQEIMGAGA